MRIIAEKGDSDAPVPMQTGDIRTLTTQSKAGLGNQGPVIKNWEPSTKIPVPTHPDMPDA